MRFVYRQSREYLRPLSWSGRVVNDVPGYAGWNEPGAQPGDMVVTTDLRGRLRFLRVVSGTEAGSTDSLAQAVGPEALFEAAGLDMAAFRPVEPVRVPPVFAEHWLAWTGVLEDAGDLPIRVEAAFGGRKAGVLRVCLPVSVLLGGRGGRRGTAPGIPC